MHIMFVITNRLICYDNLDAILAGLGGGGGGGGGGCLEHQIYNLGIGLGKSDSSNWGKPERAPH